MGERPATPQKIFDKVAPYYDFINSLLSFGQDRRWRKHLACLVDPQPGHKILDVATGTAAVAIAIAKRARDDIKVTGCDINEKMLEIGRKRIKKKKLENTITLQKNEGEALPFADASFDAVTIAFAIDDMKDRLLCANEMLRVLKPGGKILLLELSLPEKGLMKLFYEIYLGIFPLIGFVFRRANYSHLRQEIMNYRGRQAIEKLLTEIGFCDYKWKNLSGGIVTIHVGYKK